MNAPAQTRRWVVTASGLAQVAAARAGMLPWWALPLTVAITLATARQTGPVNEARARLARGAALAVVGTFALGIVARDIVSAPADADPISTMRSLTEALVVLSLAMAPLWRTPREYRLWLSVSTGVLIAAAMGSHSVTTDVLLVGTWIVVLLALAATQRASLLASATAPAPPLPRTSTPGRLSMAMPVFASLAAGIVVFLALPAGVGGGGLARHLVHRSDQDQSVEDNRGAVGVDTVGEGLLSLLVRGALPTTPLIRVPADSPPLWRGTVYSTYSGQSWQADTGERIEIVPGPKPNVPVTPNDPVPFGPTQTDRVEYASGLHASLLWTPGVALKVHGNGAPLHAIWRSAANVRLIGTNPLSGYTVTSAVAPTSPAKLEAAKGPDPANLQWTALPQELPASVSALAQRITTGATNRYEMVNDLEIYLRTHETYTLNSPVPSAGQDAVAQFLLHDHTGFCEQFASAEAVMLRTLGVPARVVSGLAYGTRQGDTRLLTAADAHAWVEVYYPGVGWSPTDPTAGVRLAPAPRGSRSSLATDLNRLAAHLPAGRAGLIVVVLVLILAAVCGGRAIRSRANRRARRPIRRARRRPVLTAFNRFAGRRRAPPRHADETAREYVDRVAEPGRLEAALLTLEQECYGADEPDRAEVAEAVAAFGAERLT